MDPTEIFVSIVTYVLLAITIFLLSFGTYALYKSTMSSGELEYCYVEFVAPPELPPMYRLRGFRSWRADSTLGTYLTIEKTVEAAASLHCSISKR